METIVAWFIYLCLHFLELCNCYPVAPLTDGSSLGIETNSFLPALLAISTITIVLLLLVGCTWCGKILKRDTRVGQPIQLQDTGSSEIVDPGILNPLNDVRFPITSPINNVAQPPRGYYEPSQQINELPLPSGNRLPDQHDLHNNNLFEDNNNGPISPQELENIVNNNAENYIVSEYENRNLNEAVQREIPSDAHLASSSSHQLTPLHSDILSQYGNWFVDSNEDVSRTQVQYLQVIGKGWFGRIVEGEVHGRGPHLNENVTRVAVKILDENVSSAEKCHFLKESQTIKDAKHNNILKYLGKNLVQDPWFILLEYCSMGDLKHFLSRHRSDAKCHDQHLPLKFITEISEAVQYLHERNIFYNVACHNCLVTEDISVRLGDYGDTKERYPDHFYPLYGTDLPIRWLPPECISGNLTNEISSNTWSIGVFMWECCSWGELPYGLLSDEEVMQKVFLNDGERLQQPVPNTPYTSYLYSIMQLCWNDNPSLRCSVSLLNQYLQALYANVCSSASPNDESLVHFNARWEALKPNTIPKVDNSLPGCSAQPSDIDFPHSEDTVQPYLKAIHHNNLSAEAITVDDIVLKVKSDSLNNLHGSLDSVSNIASSRESFNSISKDENVILEENMDEISIDKSLLKNAVPKVAPWIFEVPLKTPEDISYIKNVSDVISDFDNMLSSEKTSSSESSPSRDVVSQTSGITCDEVRSNSQMLECSTTDINSSPKEWQLRSRESAYETNVASDSVNNTLDSAPDMSAVNTLTTEDYQTLDFRLQDLNKDVELNHPLFQTNLVNCQELDSLQDSSYIPDGHKANEVSTYKRSSSGSETEDEVWKRRIELGLITEKIKMKSKSVTDFMVLTHIDMDFTDLESEDVSYTSLENRNCTEPRVGQKTNKNIYQNESDMSSEKFLSFPRSSSSQFSSIKPEFDLYRLWKNCKQSTQKSLRPSKSTSDIHESTKQMSRQDLDKFKNKMDTFFEYRNGCQSVGDDEAKRNSCSEIHFSLADPSDRVISAQAVNPVFSHNFLNNYSVNCLSVSGEEEDLKFSSNFNDLNIDIYAAENSAVKSAVPQNDSDLWESTAYMNLPDKFSFKHQSPNSEPQKSVSEEDNIATCAVSEGELCHQLDVSSSKTSTPIVDSERSTVPQVTITDLSEVSSAKLTINSLVEQQIDEIIRSEVSHIATKLAIAENENNLNIECSNSIRSDHQLELNASRQSEMDRDTLVSSEVEPDHSHADNGIVESINQVVCQQFGDKVDALLNSHQDETTRERVINNQLIQEIDSELEKLDAACELAEANYFSPETSESLYENVDPNYKAQAMSAPTGWYLHPNPNTCDPTEEPPQLNTFPLNLPASDGSSVESLTDNTNSDQYTIDPESVEALRNELNLKLPLAQRMTQMSRDNMGNASASSTKDWNSMDSPIPLCKPSIRDDYTSKHNAVEAGTSDTSLPGQSEEKNEIMIHYSVYGIVPLSPIQEESWSEFSEMEKAADMDKSDSLSLGEETSNIEQMLPFDGVCDINMADTSMKSTHNLQDDDTYSDCSNRTFVLNEAVTCPTLLKRQQSLSADSLNSMEQFDIEDEAGEKKLSVPQLVVKQNVVVSSTFSDDHSHPKSTEEISQNVDNLLENISKTLETASKINPVNVENNMASPAVSLSHLNECDTSESDNSGSKTYVIDNKIDTVLNMNALYNNQIADIPDDVSNVSKVSQPSFVSDITTPDGYDARSDKSYSMHHTKTLSMDSWCSNDTLFNVEENFDDICVGDAVSPVKKMTVYETALHCANSTPQPMLITQQPQIEMVMGCAENVNNQSIQDNDILSTVGCANDTPPQHLSKLTSLPILLPEPLLVDSHPESVERGDLKETKCEYKDESSVVVVESSSSGSAGGGGGDCDCVNESNFEAHQINMTSTPTACAPLPDTCNKNSTDGIIDHHFNFLENISDGLSFESASDSSSIVRITQSFLKNEQHFSHDYPAESSCVQSIGKDTDVSVSDTRDATGNDCVNITELNATAPTSLSNTAQVAKTFHENKMCADSLPNIDHFANNSDKSPSLEIFHSTGVNLSTFPEYSSLKVDDNSVGAEVTNQSNDQIPEPPLDQILHSESPSFELFKQSAEELPQDLAASSEREYSFSTLQELYSPDIRNIHFTGPLNEEQNGGEGVMTPPDSSTVAINIPGEIGHMAPERLKDWESESDDSNCSSTSSVDFVWKEGNGTQFLNIPILNILPPAGAIKQRGASQSFEGIPEEGEDSKCEQGQAAGEEEGEEDDEEEEVDFVPSSWDCHAAPSKSALKSPDTSQIEPRKRVVFKKQKYQNVYEYPRDDDTFHTLPDFSTYAEWNATSSSDYMPVEYQHYLSRPSPALGPHFEDDFFISSSTRPFETYSTLNSSQFFPGQQFSLVNNQLDYRELLECNDDDFESLPPIPSEQELRQALGDDVDTQNCDNNRKSSDYVTPDSGTEDTSPGDLNDFEDILNKKNLSEATQPQFVLDEGVDITTGTILESGDKIILTEANTQTSIGGLRHTRDRLKLDLPPSPLPSNSPSLVSSGKNSNKDIRIFDFKNMDILNKGDDETSGCVSKLNCVDEVDHGGQQTEKCLSSLESDTCDSDVVSPSSVISVIGKFAANTDTAKAVTSQPQDTNTNQTGLPQEAESATLQKSLFRIQDKIRRVSLEPVKGEGTLLDSGDEDSGIGSSAHATLERKCDPVFVKNSLSNDQVPALLPDSPLH